MAEIKSFHIGDVLSITTGNLVSLDHIQGVYNILDWMTGEPLMTHQLGRASDVCKSVLEESFPVLAAVVFPTYLVGGDKDAIFTWVDTQGVLYGEWWSVPKLEECLYEVQSPFLEYIQIKEKCNERT